jgi:hypothetical protein
LADAEAKSGVRRANQGAKKADLDAARKLAPSVPDLEEMRLGVGNFVQVCSLPDGHKKKVERAKSQIPDADTVSVPDTVCWKSVDSMACIAKGGGQAAWAKLVELLENRRQPWY